MSEPQAKLIDISAEPRLVVERRFWTPGMARTACSTGRVMAISIWSGGRSPASMVTAMRGNSTLGNRPTGIKKAAAMPAGDQHRQQGQQRAAAARDEAGEAHLPRTFTAMPSCSS